jgi:hypothetical protein
VPPRPPATTCDKIAPVRARSLPSGMTVFIFVVIVIFLSGILAPIAKGYARRIATSGPTPAMLQELRDELERAEQRIADAERRLHHAEERLDFQEKLLGPPSGPPRER